MKELIRKLQASKHAIAIVALLIAFSFFGLYFLDQIKVPVSVVAVAAFVTIFSIPVLIKKIFW